MMTDSRFFRRENGTYDTVCLQIDGVQTRARATDTVAAALLAFGPAPTRTTGISQSPRTPFCMMGACFDCLVTIDGRPNQQACMITVQDGMCITHQAGFRPLEEPHDG